MRDAQTATESASDASCIAPAATAASSASFFVELERVLDERRNESLESVREFMTSPAGRASYAADIPSAAYADLLYAVIDVSILAPSLESANQTFDEWDLLLLTVRRYAHQSWLVHTSIQQSAREHQLLPSGSSSSGLRTPLQLLSYFDTAYPLSVMSAAELIDTFSSARFLCVPEHRARAEYSCSYSSLSALLDHTW
jgi:hypothetical protein